MNSTCTRFLSNVITDVKAATQSLKWAVEEMERRYKVFAKYHVRNITAFNKKAAYEDRMPKIVIVIDELADLMMMCFFVKGSNVSHMVFGKYFISTFHFLNSPF